MPSLLRPSNLNARTAFRICSGPGPVEEYVMIILGIILLVIGFLTKITILWTIGIVVLVIGLILLVLGLTGRAVGGRKHWY